MSDEAGEPQPIEQVRGLVSEALRALGCPLPLSVEGARLQLGAGATARHADIAGTLAQWETLPDDLRQRRANQIAELLAGGPSVARVARPQLAASAPKEARGPRPARRGSAIAPALVFFATLIALGAAYRWLAPSSTALAPLRELFSRSAAAERRGAPVALDPDQERAELARAACGQTRARIARGANIGPSDVEGWQIELVLLRPRGAIELASDPALAQFFSLGAGARPRAVIWPRAPNLLAAQRFDASAFVRALPALGAARHSALGIVFSGPYVAPYFTESMRGEYLLLADSLAEALHATGGALYARCAESESHAIGSWFLGEDPGRALAALVFFMAGSNEVPILSREVLGAEPKPNQRSHAFDAIQRATARMDRDHTATLIGRELGMISGRQNQLSRLTFPFRDANRAARASFEAARALGLAAN